MKIMIEGHGHVATLVDQADGALSNYTFTCSCGDGRHNIATLRRQYAIDCTIEHVESHRELTADEIFCMLSR